MINSLMASRFANTNTLNNVRNIHFLNIKIGCKNLSPDSSVANISVIIQYLKTNFRKSFMKINLSNNVNLEKAIDSTDYVNMDTWHEKS